MKTRPRLKAELTLRDKLLEIAAIVLLVFIWCLPFFVFSNLPQTIPIHFNTSGQVNEYGSRSSIFILPSVATFIYLLLTIINRYPYLHNYPVNVTEENALTLYANSTKMLRYLKMIILIIFSMIEVTTYLMTIGKSNGLGIWFLPAILLVTLVPAVYFVINHIKQQNDIISNRCIYK
ncbi:DUF1648 domain-containing protein [Ferruginibacter albus]|uniref:DUF1648 domain-containing protein n=1 Tax=Ferruginibacter albus TaxID=2875540 RepID=UPI001CC60C19|nr:DUF1648 domain-containing protein [Ferruginibacter albus]UAY51400.1 DUF1648 domain-containing protein [Ferruginibacter albus]